MTIWNKYNIYNLVHLGELPSAMTADGAREVKPKMIMMGIPERE
jgi:hypothetical protein